MVFKTLLMEPMQLVGICVVLVLCVGCREAFIAFPMDSDSGDSEPYAPVVRDTATPEENDSPPDTIIGGDSSSGVVFTDTADAVVIVVDTNDDMDLEEDEDGDGWTASMDCNDSDPAIFPEAEDIPGNQIDENCDGLDGGYPLPLDYELCAGGVIRAEDMEERSTGGFDGSGWNIWSEGYISTEIRIIPDQSLQIIARGDVAEGVWPQMRVVVSGLLDKTIAVDSASWQSYLFDLNASSESTGVVTISFLNDFFVGDYDNDRNLRIDEMRQLCPVSSN